MTPLSLRNITMKDSKVLPFIQGDVKCKTCAPVQIIGTMAVLGVIAVGLGLGLGSGLQSDDDPSPAPVCFCAGGIAASGAACTTTGNVCATCDDRLKISANGKSCEACTTANAISYCANCTVASCNAG